MNHEETSQAIEVDELTLRRTKGWRGTIFGSVHLIEPDRLITRTLDRTDTSSGCRSSSDRYGLSTPAESAREVDGPSTRMTR